MDITPLIPSERKVINGYGNNSFRINGESINSSITIYEDKFSSIDISSIDDLDTSHFKFFEQFETKPEFIIIGTGKNHIMSQKITIIARNMGIRIEPMQTGAACRTYNVLLSEGRNIGALLIAI